MKTPTIAEAREKTRFIRWFDDLTNTDVAIAGGKNASLGELARALRPKGIDVPDGFAVTAEAYRSFLDYNDPPKFSPRYHQTGVQSLSRNAERDRWLTALQKSFL